jgi:hypothetical protein
MDFIIVLKTVFFKLYPISLVGVYDLFRLFKNHNIARFLKLNNLFSTFFSTYN